MEPLVKGLSNTVVFCRMDHGLVVGVAEIIP